MKAPLATVFFAFIILIVAIPAMAQSGGYVTILSPTGQITGAVGTTIQVPVSIDFSTALISSTNSMAGFDVLAHYDSGSLSLPNNFGVFAPGTSAAQSFSFLHPAWTLPLSPGYDATDGLMTGTGNSDAITSLGTLGTQPLLTFDMNLTIKGNAPLGVTSLSFSGYVPTYFDIDANIGLHTNSPININVVAAPEPASFSLLLAGLAVAAGGLAIKRRRRVSKPGCSIPFKTDADIGRFRHSKAA